MTTTVHHRRFRWRRQSKWHRVWRRTLGAAFIVLTVLAFFWGLVGACETTALPP